MPKASQIVDALLETDEPLNPDLPPEDAEAERYLDQLGGEVEAGELNYYTAQTAREFYHRTITNADGYSPAVARRNGATKTWKTRPGQFRIPVKHGMYEYFYITDKDTADWSIVPMYHERPKKVKKPRARSVVNPADLMPPPAH